VRIVYICIVAKKEDVMKNYVKPFEVVLRVPMVFVLTKGKTNLIMSHVLSTIMTVLCLTYIPWLAPLFMEQCQSSKI